LSKEKLTQAIKAASKAVDKRFKKRVGSGQASETLLPVSAWVSTGSMALDRICAGFNPSGLPVGPFGRIVHLPGDWSTGKSLILDHLFKSVQEAGGLGLCSETEATRDPHFAKAIGLDLSLLEIQRPLTLEELFDAGLEWHSNVRAQPGCKDIPIIWGIDSLDSTVSGKSADKGMSEGGGWKYGGGKSEALGEALRRVANQVCARHPTTLVMLNQTRENIGVMFGPKKRTPGGNPPSFYSSLEIWLSPGRMGVKRGEYKGAKLTPEQRKRLGMGKEQGNIIGRWIQAEVKKTKVGQTMGAKCDFYIDFRRGVNRWAGLFQRMLEEGKVALNEKDIVCGDQVFKKETEWVQWLMAHPEELR